MSAEHPTAIFADQVRQGMRLEHPRDLYDDDSRQRWGGVFIVTQVRHSMSSWFGGEPASMVTILGVRDDGSPYHYGCGGHMVWLCHDAGPVRTAP